MKLFGKYAGKIHPKLEGSKAVWFIGVSKNTFLIIIMMTVAACTETEEQVENYLSGCVTGKRDLENPENCTTLTLTKIRNVQPPEFTYPSFHYNYEFCNEKVEGSDEWQFASDLRFPDDFDIETYNFTTVSGTCKENQKEDVWFVSFNDIWIELSQVFNFMLMNAL